MTFAPIRGTAAAVYILAVAGMCVRAGEPDQLWWWLAMLPFVAWIASPVLGGLYLSRRVGRAPARLLFGALLIVIALGGFALQWHTMVIAPSDAQNALIFVFVPLYQWAGVALALALAWLLGKALGQAGQTQ